jgi:hypothetical protein
MVTRGGEREEGEGEGVGRMRGRVEGFRVDEEMRR